VRFTLMRLSFEADWVSPTPAVASLPAGRRPFLSSLAARPYHAQKRDAHACPLVDHRRDDNWHGHNSGVRAARLLTPLANDPPPPLARPLFCQGRQPLGRGPRARQWSARCGFVVSPYLGGGRPLLGGGKLAGVDRGYALAGGDCDAQLGCGEHRQRLSAIGKRPAMKN
jgi:hypothetical protein